MKIEIIYVFISVAECILVDILELIFPTLSQSCGEYLKTLGLVSFSMVQGTSEGVTECLQSIENIWNVTVQKFI